MKDILLVCPQERDLRAIRSAGLAQRYRIHCAGADLDAIDDFDPKSFIEECDAIPADGVVGTKDRSALIAALIAERRGLPGPSPRAMTACQFKPTARALQRATVPAATPRFALLDGRPPFGPPFFVKPVVGRLSQRAQRIDDPVEMELLEEADRYMTRYARIAELAGLHPDAVRGFLAEELLSGLEVTYEGYVHEGRVVTIGVTDSQKYEGTNSFERFEFPSALPAERLAELEDVSTRADARARVRWGLLQRRVLHSRRGPRPDHRGQRPYGFPVLAPRSGRARPLDLRRDVQARLRRGSRVGARPRRGRRPFVLPARLRGRVRGIRARGGRRTSSSCSYGRACVSRSRA